MNTINFRGDYRTNRYAYSFNDPVNLVDPFGHYAIDSEGNVFDEILNLGGTLQKYISGNSRAFQNSDLKRAIDETIATGRPVEFSTNGLGIAVSLYDKAYIEAGRIFGDFVVDVNGKISVDGSGKYSIEGASATIDQSQRYNFTRDGRNPVVNFAIGTAASRPNMNGPNIEDYAHGYNSNYNSNYGMANIATQTNRSYNFQAWGEIRGE